MFEDIDKHFDVEAELINFSVVFIELLQILLDVVLLMGVIECFFPQIHNQSGLSLLFFSYLGLALCFFLRYFGRILLSHFFDHVVELVPPLVHGVHGGQEGLFAFEAVFAELVKGLFGEGGLVVAEGPGAA